MRVKRYREGLPARDDEERAAYREWSELDADNRQSAYEEFWGADQAYERYDGPLDFDAFLSEWRRDQDLAAWGIERQELPELYESALGPERGERLQRQIEDARAQLTSPRQVASSARSGPSSWSPLAER